MFAGKRALVVGLGRSNVGHHNPLIIKYVFSSITDHQGPTTPGKLSKKCRDGTLEGPEGGHGGLGISNTTNQAVESSQGGGPTRDPITGHYKVRLSTQPARGERGRRKEGMDDIANEVAEKAKEAAVGALDTGLKLGDIAKEAVDSVWDVAKKTAERVRDTVVEDDHVDHNRNKKTRGGHGYN